MSEPKWVECISCLKHRNCMTYLNGSQRIGVGCYRGKTERENRLFVPVTSEVFRWYQQGKCWEIRKVRKSFNAEHARKYDRVEVRRGYSTKDSLYGDITEIVEANNLKDLFEQIKKKDGSYNFYKKIIPDRNFEADAINVASIYIGKFPHESVQLFAFRVENLKKEQGNGGK